MGQKNLHLRKQNSPNTNRRATNRCPKAQNSAFLVLHKIQKHRQRSTDTRNVQKFRAFFQDKINNKYVTKERRNEETKKEKKL